MQDFEAVIEKLAEEHSLALGIWTMKLVQSNPQQ